MNEPNANGRQAEEARRKAISILGSLTEKADEFELPEPPEALERHRRRLEENAYKVLVVGEASRGKSTFVNALIGQEVLPTEVTATTSQVFNVRPAEREAYRLRLEDDSEQEITRADLPSYGSQVLEDAGEGADLDKIVRWIEVDVPMRFLPANVSILDTPGVGSLYAGHAQITRRFVPQADAVIFVLDSERPVIQRELDFLDEILEVTRDVFFIQTKIKMYKREDWQGKLRRSEEVLREKFGDRLADARVWPIDSKLLMQAATGEDDVDAEEDLEDSNYEEVEAALRAFLFRAAGWSRSARAILEAESYYDSSATKLSERLSGFLARSEQERAGMLRRVAQREQKFQDEWEDPGYERERMMGELRRTFEANERDFLRALDPDGKVAGRVNNRIEVLGSLDEANWWSRGLHEEVLKAVSDEWREARIRTEAGCARLIGPLQEAVDPSTPDLKPEAVLGPDPRKVELTDGIAEVLKYFGGKEHMIKEMIEEYLPERYKSLTRLYVIAEVVLPQIVKRRTLMEAKEELRKVLHEDLRAVKRFFQAAGTRRRGMLEEYFGELDRITADQVRALVERKTGEARAEVARLEESSRLDEQQREARAGQIKHQLAEWQKIGEAIVKVMERLETLEQRGTTPTRAEHRSREERRLEP